VCVCVCAGRQRCQRIRSCVGWAQGFREGEKEKVKVKERRKSETKTDVMQMYAALGLGVGFRV
jgi:hypothetical protein